VAEGCGALLKMPSRSTNCSQRAKSNIWSLFDCKILTERKISFAVPIDSKSKGLRLETIEGKERYHWHIKGQGIKRDRMTWTSKDGSTDKYRAED
jgi:hypothetical protein